MWRTIGASVCCIAACGRIAFDPLTDADGVSCYAPIPSMLYADAEAECQARGAHLVTIDDGSENAQLMTKVPTPFFIGYNDRAVEGTFVWVGPPSAIGFENWAIGQPNDGQTGGLTEDCASVRDDGLWYDEECGAEMQAAVCECP